MATEKIWGLTETEVQGQREKYGRNILHPDTQNKTLILIKEIVTEPLFVILVFASFIYFFLGESTEGIIMLIALSFVSSISFYQEEKSRKALDALKFLSSPHAKVYRNGSLIQISAEDLVVGDYLVIEDGDIISADGIIIEAHDFLVNESIITGESLGILKNQNEGNNLVLQGTMVIGGSAITKVTAVGSQTVFGKIDQSLKDIKVSKTPLQIKIQSFVKSLVGIGTVAFFLVWLVNYYLSHLIWQSLLQGLTLAMSILPEEIPVAFSTFMALGAYRLHKQKVIVQSPHTVETLGAATVICVDKTGTITENNMRLAAIFNLKENTVYDYTSGEYKENEVLEFAMWSSELQPFDNMEKSIHHAYSESATVDKRSKYKIIHEYPLGGVPPMMTHVFANATNETIIAVKGSVEALLKHSKLSEIEKEIIQKESKTLALKGYRVLGVGKSNHSGQQLPKLQEELEFEFLGLIAFYDPPKQNMTKTLAKFYEAGISVKIITGDYTETTASIARQINFRNCKTVLTGVEVAQMEMAELQKKVVNVDIYTRMFPDAKLKVIEALKLNGEVVAMTGDGVNDAPALKSAHIGIAMGLRGSEVAKKSASLILMDDDLYHMTEAVEMGRRIYENLKKAILYIISIHIPIILIVTIPLILFWKFRVLFTPIHVIILELIMGPTCSIVFEREPIEKNSMKTPPRKMNLTFFSFKELSISVIQGLVITVSCLSLAYYYMAMGNDETVVRTITFSTLIFSNLFLTLTNRSISDSVFTTLKYKNTLVPIVLFVSLVVLFSAIYFPATQKLFYFSDINSMQFLSSVVAAFIGVMWIEVFKMIVRNKLKNLSSLN